MVSPISNTSPTPPPERILSLPDDLEPVNHFGLERDEEDSEEWTAKSKALLQRPDVTAAIKANAAIPKNSFCNDPEAVVKLTLKPNTDKAKLYVRQYPIAHVKERYVDEQIADVAQERQDRTSTSRMCGKQPHPLCPQDGRWPRCT